MPGTLQSHSLSYDVTLRSSFNERAFKRDQSAKDDGKRHDEADPRFNGGLERVKIIEIVKDYAIPSELSRRRTCNSEVAGQFPRALMRKYDFIYHAE